MKQLSDDTLQRHAVSCLIGHCESIAEHGRLSEPSERSLRMLIAYVLSVYHMPSKAERAFQPLPQEFTDDRFETLVASERNMAVAVEPLLRLLVNNEVKR